MKLLLTSNGLSNESIANALFDLVGKLPTETTVAFIPTAMNIGRGDKDWFVDDLMNIKKQGLKCLDIVDISALPIAVWKPRLEVADVLFFSGGHTSHLMHWIIESGLRELLPEFLKTKVWASISAGSMVTNPSLALSSNDKKIYYEETTGYRSDEGLNYVDFYVRPHYNSTYFPKASKEYLEQIAGDFKAKIYALDDMSALKVVNGVVEIVTEGDFLVLN